MSQEQKKEEVKKACSDCGIKANFYTCMKKYGQPPLKKCFDLSTFHTAICDVCGEEKSVTEPRDFFYPDFSLLKQITN